MKREKAKPRRFAVRYVCETYEETTILAKDAAELVGSPAVGGARLGGACSARPQARAKFERGDRDEGSMVIDTLNVEIKSVKEET